MRRGSPRGEVRGERAPFEVERVRPAFCSCMNSMTPDDAHTSHSHGFELPNAPRVVVRADPRPWRAVAGVALCLGLAGIVTGLIVARQQRMSDAHITSDALQREDLRDGWRALGVAAARDAQLREEADQAAKVANSATAAPAQPSVVIVNVPVPNASAAPPNVTNITLPSGATRESGAPSDNWNFGSGYVPNPASAANQSVPPVNYSPVVPLQTPYPLPPDNASAGSNYTPQNSYGQSSGTVAPSVGNGTIPGSSTNPALPNNGLVGSSPTTGLPNGSTNGGATPNAPMGGTPPPAQPSLPSGFSAP